MVEAADDVSTMDTRVVWEVEKLQALEMSYLVALLVRSSPVGRVGVV